MVGIRSLYNIHKYIYYIHVWYLIGDIIYYITLYILYVYININIYIYIYMYIISIQVYTENK